MKKNIVIVVLTIFSALCLLYAYVQQAEAVKQREYAIQQRQVAEENEHKAMEAMKRVEEFKLLMEHSNHALTDALASTLKEKQRAEDAYEHAKAASEAARK